MKEKLEIHELMDRAIAVLKKEGYADYSVRHYRTCYNHLLKFIDGKNITYYSDDLAIDFIKQKYGATIVGFYIDSFYTQSPRNSRSSIRAFRLLSDYCKDGEVVKKKKMAHRPFECPDEFIKAYEAFKLDRQSRHYAPSGEARLFYTLHHFLIFMKDERLASSAEISSIHILKYLTYYQHYGADYVSKLILMLRCYLPFLYKENYTEQDLSKCLPSLRNNKYPFIPSVWDRSDVKKVLEAIDRQNAQGKRDYAIILLVARLGLRVSDVRALKLSNLNWGRRQISITMQKTKQLLELPLLEDVGWAIIDYLKNGRPQQTRSDFVFIRHIAPYEGFNQFNNLHQMLNRYMDFAKIEKTDQKRGLHSLRSTLALALLDSGTPLSTISEALGHQSIHTTRFYLKIDMNGLRNCVIDPEEVCHD